MANLYDIDYQLQIKNLISPTKRKPKILAYLYGIIFALQYLRNKWLGDYKSGVTYPFYDPFNSYYRGDRVVFTDGRIYENINPVGVGTVGIDPSDVTVWELYLDNFIGVDERVKYNAQIIVFEYALNKWFQVAASDPQIYIQTNSVGNAFVMGNTAQYSSTMANKMGITAYMGNTFLPTGYTYTIFVPVALYTALGSTATNRENTVRSFADKYNVAGTNYDIQTF